MLTLAFTLSLLAASPTSLPDVAVTTQTGHKLSLASWRGQPVVVAFWATWCQPCRQELATLERLASAPGARFKVLAIAADAQGWKTVLPFLRERKHTLPVVLLTPSLARAFRVHPSTSSLPLTLFFDRQSRLAGCIDGALPAERLAGLIAALVSTADSQPAATLHGLP